MQDWSGNLETAANIVVSAGKYIKSKLGGTFLTSFKTCPADMVTEVDQYSQSIILEGLEKAFPGHRLVAEEGFSEEELVHSENPVWFIDPLDGTTNFVFGIPLCAVTAAMTVKGNPVLGVTYDPFREELFTAAIGKGTYKNGRRVRVDSRERLSDSLIATGFPASDRFKDEMWKANYKNMFYKASDIRAFGSAALELAYIACGRLTGYWEAGLSPWDVAAGIILVREAGGTVSSLSGGDLELGRYVSIAASNGLIHQELLGNLGYNDEN